MTNYKNWKIHVNEEETETLTITRKFADTNIIRPLRINDKNIKPSRKTKYLGVTFDRTLRYQPHVSNIVS